MRLSALPKLYQASRNAFTASSICDTETDPSVDPTVACFSRSKADKLR
eukprot:SAG25_NODE_647_length_6214_cov_5.107277_6_plen_48_part_00